MFAREAGEGPLDTAGQVRTRWEEIKAQERASQHAAGTPAAAKSLLSGLAPALPALLRAYHISTRAASVGFDWSGAGDVVNKMQEEVNEIRQVVDAPGQVDHGRAEEEMGDLLFSIANLARKLHIEPESALRKANGKFSARFEKLEQAFEARGRSLHDATLEEMEAEWQRIKADA